MLCVGLHLVILMAERSSRFCVIVVAHTQLWKVSGVKQGRGTSGAWGQETQPKTTRGESLKTMLPKLDEAKPQRTETSCQTT